MPLFSAGLDAEVRLANLLREYGCKVDRDEIVNHTHKIDFVVSKLPTFDRLLQEPLGMQVTFKLDDVQKKADFLRLATRKPYAPKNIYVELAPGFQLEYGGAFMVLVAITQFLTEEPFKHQKLAVVRIKSDLTYEFTAVETSRRADTSLHAPQRKLPAPAPEVVHPLRISAPAALPLRGPAQPTYSGAPVRPSRSAREPEFPSWVSPRPPSATEVIGKSLETNTSAEQLAEHPISSGFITHYNSKKLYGFIEECSGADERGQIYFFHISDIIDQDLLVALTKLPPKNDPDALGKLNYIEFEDGGQASGEKYPKAIRISEILFRRVQ